MMNEELLALAGALVKELALSIDNGTINLLNAEQKIVEYLNRLGGMMIESIVTSVSEPTKENRLNVEDKMAVYDKQRPLTFISRFGNTIQRMRRCYKVQGESKGFAPLDEKLGVKSRGYSPLMTYLMAVFGGSAAFAPEARKLSEVIGFQVSSTALQWNTERTGQRIPENPIDAIEGDEESAPCDMMIVEIDGTMSPQIMEIPGKTGRESLKNATEYKECNVVVIEKRIEGELSKRWYGALYGPRKLFDVHVHRSALKMGQMQAKKVAFIADGAHSNWEIQSNNFPEAVTILDFYHATEHLADFCSLLPNQERAKALLVKWRHMLLGGDNLQVIEEMKESLPDIFKKDAALTQINYFENNKNRMAYDEYKASGYPIGSGLVEGACKYVVNRRFKGSGMRWKKQDNASVLRVRLAIINENLSDYFRPRPRKFSIFLARQEGVAA
jgi:hypothetical protein